MPLEEYRSKRHFNRTPEPPPEHDAGRPGPLTFVIQKHAASRLHYDFRLEVDGVLKSWAVPKGPSLNPADKRLAMMVEDHPLDYAGFEGIIPKGEYGGGQVIVWDRGTYAPDPEREAPIEDRARAEEEMRRGLEQGKISVFLRGEKLHGSWTLVHTKGGAPNQWLLIKHRDGFASPEIDITEADASVASGLTIEDLKAGRLPPQRDAGEPPPRPEDLPGARKARLPSSIAPMMATLTDHPFSRPEWLFEPKLDGVRAIALVQQGKVKLLSRRGLDAAKQYPSLAEELSRQPEREMALDGEIVALDERGVPSFNLLQQRLNLTREPDIRRAEMAIPVVYYVFDLLYLDGYDLRGVPLEDRKRLLEATVRPFQRLRLLEHFDAEGEAAYSAAVEHGLEGVVAKRRDSFYESGRRSHGWLKVKATLSDDFVIGGYGEGEGARKETIGSVLVGTFDDSGRLQYAAHVGSGFDDRTLAEVRRRLDALRTDACPFVTEPPRHGKTTWVKPELVAEVKFAQWTKDGHLRAPVFLRLREDKAPSEAARVEVAPAPRDVALPANGARSPDGAPSVDAAGDLVEQLQRMNEKGRLGVEGFDIALNNLDKELWPATGDRRALTKRDLLVYLAEVAPLVLPHMRDRQLTLTRYPNGIQRDRFYQKRWEAPLPEFVQTVRMFSEENNGDRDYLVCNNLPTLMWLGQIADLELHTSLARMNHNPDAGHLSLDATGSKEKSRRSIINYPDFIVFDLDPYLYSGHEAKGEEPELNREGFERTCRVARWLKELLDNMGLAAFVKTSGKTGLHVFVPVLRQFDYETTRSLAGTIGGFLLRQHVGDVTMEWSTEKRTGKVFLDHNQNAYGKSMAGIYSPRPLAEATVSMPLRWEELDDVFPTDFTLLTAPERLARTGDLWAGILDHKGDLGALLSATGTPA